MRLFLSHAIVMLIGVLVLALALLVLLRQGETRRIQRQLSIAASTVNRIGRLVQINDTRERLIERLNRLGQDQRARILLLNAGGVVTVDSAPNPQVSMVGNTLPLDEFLQTGTTTSETPAIGEFRDPSGRRFTYAAVQTQTNRRDLAHWVVLSSPVNNGVVLGLLDDISAPILQALLLALVSAAIAAALIARSIAKPIQRVAVGAQALAQGDYSKRVTVAGPVEVRQLADDFNQMAAQVQQVRQSERDFVANVSHELKTPLTSIQGFAQAIRDGDVVDADATRNAARIIYEEADRLRRMTSGLLDSARLESGDLRMVLGAVQLNDLARSCVDKLAPHASSTGVGLHAVLAPNLPALTGDGDRLAQVLMNLLDNALKHTSSGGTVTVGTQLATRRGISGQWIELSVADTGQGIHPDDIPHIFERFYQADKSRSTGHTSGSAGLGLSICKQIVEAHRGQIVAQSVPGLGTRMTVWLPA
jgi:signal transduction histidine kinase